MLLKQNLEIKIDSNFIGFNFYMELHFKMHTVELLKNVFSIRLRYIKMYD
ncbi:hypothetical protein LEP1GSC082_0795 [Leptospira kirschneri str. H2]|nr:hypothetical protein LEP1GSC082_0795 [Leptospira kirschneri str. H2]